MYYDSPENATLDRLRERTANLPEPMRSASRWLMWKAAPHPKKPGKARKVPYYANGRMRNGELDTPGDLAQLVTLDEALDTLDRFDGLGFALVADDNIACIDLDGCLDANKSLVEGHAGVDLAINAEVAGAYVEVSPGGDGLHILGPCTAAEAYSQDGVEAWGEKRFITVTADVFANPGEWTDITALRPVKTAHTQGVRRDDEDGAIITPDILDDLRGALKSIPSDDRTLWVRMGHALRTIPSDKGRDLWMEWSARSKKFDPADALEKWRGFKPTGTDHRAVFAEAQRQGWDNPARKSKAGAKNEQAGVKRRHIDLGDTPDLHATEFVLDGFLPTGVSVIAGAWGAGKSTNFIPLMASVAHLAPEAWDFRPALRRKVIWVTEAPEQARDTLCSLARVEGAADWQEFKEWFYLYPAKRQPTEDTVEELKALVEEFTWTTETGFRVKPVINLDTTTANIDLENESDNAEVGKAMSVLKQSLPGIPIVLIGHTPKAAIRGNLEDMSFRGAGAWEAEANATYYLVYDQPTDTRFLAIRKARFTPTYREVAFDSEMGSQIVDTPWGEPQHKTYLHGVPAKSNGEERRAAQQEAREERRTERQTLAQIAREEEVLAAIRDGAAEGRLVTRKALYLEPGGKQSSIRDALMRLIENGAITERNIDKRYFEGSGPPPSIFLPSEVDLQLFLATLAEKGTELSEEGGS